MMTQFALEEWFTSIAERLILHSTLVVGDARYRFVEVEFYFYSDIHRDLFCRRSPGQLSICKWHFHRKGETYREGNYRGLDITFGNNAYGAILIRSLQKDDTIIEGPCLVVNEILSACGAKSVADLAANSEFQESIFDGLMHIVSEEHPKTHVFRAARYGLIPRGNAYLPFVAAPYRYAIRLCKIKKGIQNFVLEMFVDGYPPSEISMLTGCSPAIYHGWLIAFIAGHQENEQPVFGERLSVHDAAKAYGYYKRNY